MTKHIRTNELNLSDDRSYYCMVCKCIINDEYMSATWQDCNSAKDYKVSYQDCKRAQKKIEAIKSGYWLD